MNRLGMLGLFVLCVLGGPVAAESGGLVSVSGIYPHLVLSNNEDECGTGAIVPWADRLWVITYGPHLPEGSSDKLYEITPDLRKIVRPESVGGTPANRMIHRESNQLFIGPYAIASNGSVRVIAISNMTGRLTGTARHLTDPANKIYTASMEEALYEVDVRSLEVKTLIRDDNKKNKFRPANWENAFFSQLPGWHGKGLYRGFGRLFFSNNGEKNPAVIANPEDIHSGSLGEWTGEGDWKLIRRSQFTEITGPDGIHGGNNPEDPVWTFGWDYRSAVLMVNTNNIWTSYRLPKTSHAYDGGHGWHTEWPRIREIGEGENFLMTMHGSFWNFPRGFKPGHAAGISPRSSYLKVIGDFCRWGDFVVMGCDDTARNEFANGRPVKAGTRKPGQSQSNLWFVKPDRLSSFGTPQGRGAVWLREPVKAHVPSDPYLFAGYSKRMVWLKHTADKPVTFTFEIDRAGTGVWEKLRDVSVAKAQPVFFGPERGEWIRVRTDADCAEASVMFFYDNEHRHSTGETVFDGVASTPAPTAGTLYLSVEDPTVLRYALSDAEGYALTGDLKLVKMKDSAVAAATRAAMPISTNAVSEDAASIVYTYSRGIRRLPRGRSDSVVYGRRCREICTERDLLNVGGTFYELPAENSGGFNKIRPIATHNRAIADYAAFRGLFVISGIDAETKSGHIVRSDDGKGALWIGAIDDLWQFGKPVGVGGPWLKTSVKAGIWSDPYLMNGFDQKEVELSADRDGVIRLEVDIDGTGNWVSAGDFTLKAGQTVRHVFPTAFSAYWVRVSADADCTATAQFIYR